MAPKNKLTYFPVKALGEPIRLLFVYMDEDFEDNRFKVEDWPTLKTRMPWGKVPLLEVDGKQVSQHLAICRYLGRKAGLNGKDAWEDLKIDEIVDVINELRAELAKYFYEKDEKRKAEVKGPLTKEILPFYMKKLDVHVKENSGFLANKKLSWADLYFAGVVDYFCFMHGTDITADYPHMKALRTKVENLPKIKEWIAKRPQSEF